MPGRFALRDADNTTRKLLRMSWSPINTWILATKEPYDDASLRRTVFQQRWIAKRELRGYHLPNITEKQFLERHFQSKIKLQHFPQEEKHRLPPIAALALAGSERRVDVVVFRSHFAKSIANARNLVSKGHVKINGVVSTVPCRALKDGDMVSVNPNMIPTLQGPPDTVRQFKFIPYMAPYMFIPEYLEVNYELCSTIFLRSPLPILDGVEIPSPQPPEMHQLFYEWYATKQRIKKRNPNYSSTHLNGIKINLKPKFESIFRQDQLKRGLIRKGQQYKSKTVVDTRLQRPIVRFKYVPKKRGNTTA